jgi:hypothetical protein
VRLNRDKTESRTTVPGSVADVAEVSGHRSTVDTNRACVCVAAFAFIERDHQERGHERKWDRAAQIGERFKRPREGLDDPLVAWRYGGVGTQRTTV